MSSSAITVSSCTLTLNTRSPVAFQYTSVKYRLTVYVASAGTGTVYVNVLPKRLVW